MPQPNRVFDVRCSCGKIAVLRIDEKGFCRCDDPSWEYHADPDDNPRHKDESHLWHCGADGHFQDGVRNHVETADAAQA